jgi:hypothetical protein
MYSGSNFSRNIQLNLTGCLLKRLAIIAVANVQRQANETVQYRGLVLSL